MSFRLRVFFMGLMTLALLFGFLHLFVPAGMDLNFDRLHIFLFNLCSGGTILIFHTEGRRHLSGQAVGFCALSLVYAVLAFLKIYLPAIVISLILAGVVERVRVRRFSFFPWDFFRSETPVADKFHQASLLCLSIGLVISTLVILNNEYLKVLSWSKLQLDTFFLGFSFPLSLITMSVMFSLMKDEFREWLGVLKNIDFWAVNLGVITFFIFILAELLIPQLVVTLILFAAVIVMYYLFDRLGLRVQQKNFLISGMAFLLFTAVSGILYIVLEVFWGYDSDRMNLLMRIHAFASLYGWNLSGLAVICRQHDFPIQLHSTRIIALHWLTVILLAPMGIYFRSVALAAVICYFLMLYFILFSEGVQSASRDTESSAETVVVYMDD